MIRYGYACKTIGVPGTAQTSLILARATEENLLAICRHNLKALGNMLLFCRENDISLLRISSDIIPLGSHPDVSFDWVSLLRDEFLAVADIIKNTGIRVSMHPGQYTVLNSPKEDVVERAVADLVYHSEVLDALEAPPSARIILHLGGLYGDKAASLERLVANMQKLPEKALTRLALENDERMYTIEDVLEVCGRFGLPAIFDVFHHSLNAPEKGDWLYWLDRAGETWNAGNGTQKIHYSQQLEGGKPGQHSRTIFMEEFLPFYKALGERTFDVMLEVKDKNLSAIKCANLSDPHLLRKKLTDEWARYKYLVLEHSHNDYKAIRELLKQDAPSAMEFYRHIETALAREATPKSAVNAAQHVWGYFNTLAEPAEAKKVLADLEKIGTDALAVGRIKRKLLAMAEKYDVQYLLNSLYFYM